MKGKEIMGGRVLTVKQLRELLEHVPSDVPVYSTGRNGGGAIEIIHHPHSIVIRFGPEDSE